MGGWVLSSVGLSSLVSVWTSVSSSWAFNAVRLARSRASASRSRADAVVCSAVATASSCALASSPQMRDAIGQCAHIAVQTVLVANTFELGGDIGGFALGALDTGFLGPGRFLVKLALGAGFRMGR